MEILETLAYLLCSTLPIQWLAYYPFRNMLRFPGPAATGLIATSILVKLSLCFLALSHGFSPYQVEFLFAPIHLAVYLVNIRVQPFKLLFTYLLLLDYLMVIRGVSAFFIGKFAGAARGCWQDSAVCLLLFAVTFPFMIRFFQNASEKVYRINAPIWNTIWTVPAFTSVVVLLFTRDFAPDTVRSLSFLLARLGLLICVLAVYHVLLQALESFQKQTILEAQKDQMERILSLQKEQYALLKNQNEETRRFRHDLRQRLVAADHYLSEGQTEQLSRYLNAMLGDLPSGTDSVCPNDAVNAVALYHQAAALRAGISSVSLRLEQIPAELCPPPGAGRRSVRADRQPSGKRRGCMQRSGTALHPDAQPVRGRDPDHYHGQPFLSCQPDSGRRISLHPARRRHRASLYPVHCGKIRRRMQIRNRGKRLFLLRLPAAFPLNERAAPWGRRLFITAPVSEAYSHTVCPDFPRMWTVSS